MTNNQTFKLSDNNKTIRFSPVAYYLRDFNDSFFMSYHIHHYLEFMYCVSGSFKVSVFDKKTNSYKSMVLCENEFIYINPNIKHRLILENGMSAKIANIEFAILNDHDVALEKCINYTFFFLYYLKDLYNTDDGFVISKDNNLVRSNLVNLITYLEEKPNKNYLQQSMNILSFFYAIKESMTKEKEGDYAFVRQAIQYIYENLQRRLSVEEIANYVNKSPSYFSHKFKEDTGVSVLKYINNARIDKARLLLKNTSFSINQIAHEVGYKNKDQLNYQFKANINCTPSEYKKRVVYKSIDNRMVDGTYHSIDFD